MYVCMYLRIVIQFSNPSLCFARMWSLDNDDGRYKVLSTPDEEIGEDIPETEFESHPHPVRRYACTCKAVREQRMKKFLIPTCTNLNKCVARFDA